MSAIAISPFLTRGTRSMPIQTKMLTVSSACAAKARISSFSTSDIFELPLNY
jgi:hypothetical protein